ILLIGVLYLLSFGPVKRYCGTVISQSSTPIAFTVNGQTVVRGGMRTVRYPGWVGIVYHPAFLLESGSGGSGLYGRYLQWWGQSGKPKMTTNPDEKPAVAARNALAFQFGCPLPGVTEGG